jgi:hypothetical protein
MSHAKIEQSAFTFLRNLSKNNNRDWFDKHKDQYLQAQLNVEQFVSSPQKLFEWTWRLHNTVNLSKDFKTRSITLQEAMDIYKNSDDDTLMMIFL